LWITQINLFRPVSEKIRSRSALELGGLKKNFSPGPKPALGGPVADSYGVDDSVLMDDQITQRKRKAAKLYTLVAR